MKATQDHYTVLLTRESGIWLVEATDLQGVRSFGRTVADATRNISEAIAAAEDLSEWGSLQLSFTFEDEHATNALRVFRAADEAEVKASATRDEALAVLIDSLRSRGMSYRDIGTVIGLSHQRVAQLDGQARV